MAKLQRFVSSFSACLILGCASASAQVRLSEFMAANTHTLADEDGAFSDWIELQNTSLTNVNLLDWSLTDSAGNLTKWRFPATNLPPNGFLVVFASNKNRRTAGSPLHTNFKLDAAGEYLALVDPSGTNVITQFAPAYPPQVPDVSYGFALTVSNVVLVATGATARVLVPSLANGGNALNYTWTGDPTNEPFDTVSWISGPTGMGFPSGAAPGDLGSDLQSVMLSSNASAFARLPFFVADPTTFSLLQLRLKYDDGYVAWINGVRVVQANAPAEDLNWDSAAANEHSTTTYESLLLGGASALLRPGTNILAFQGLNIAATNDTFLLLPELTGISVAGDKLGLYFTTPTPGAPNIGGATAPGPGIADVKHTPNVPLDNDNLVVTARVFPTAHSLATVTLHFRVMFDPEISVAMFDDGAHGDGAAGDGVYGGTIPASASTSGQMVRYYVTASDTSGNVSRVPVFPDPASTAEYFGTVVNPGIVTSTLPVIHIFAPASVLQPGPTTSQTGADSETGGRVSLFSDGEFYDNVQMQLRGNSTAGYNKKSHRVEFNAEHPFRHTGPGGRIRKTSFEADYPDPTYLRQGLSFWLCEQLGVPAPFCIPVRLQLNGAFYELATHSDVQGEEMLKRLGYDPNGAYYANVGTVVPSQFSTGGFEKKTRKTEGNTDYAALASAISEALPVGQRTTNLFDRLDLPEVINYMAVARFTHQNDDVWANMALYHDNDGDDLWRVMPYDMNLSWGAAFMNSAGTDPIGFNGIQATNDNLKSFPLYGSSKAVPEGASDWNRMYDVIFTVPQTREMVLRRLRTLLDTYVKPPGTSKALVPVEQEAIAWRGSIAGEAQRDRAWWGWPGKGGQGNFDPGIDLTNGVASLIHDFIDARRNHFYGKHSATNTALPIGITKTSNAGIPLAQPTNTVIAFASLDCQPASGNQDEEYVQLTNANSYAVDVSGWKLAGGVDFKFAGGTVMPAHGSLFVSPNIRAFRSRSTGPRGGQGLFVVGPCRGHLDAWGETLTLTDNVGRLVSSNSFIGNPSPAQRYLRITEIMYHPSPAPAIDSDPEQFEYIELKNISTNVILSLTGVRFTNGIDFNFTGSAVASLAPGQTVLIVRNPAAFGARYGSGFTIAGQYTGALDDAGETLRLEDAVGEKILEFSYNNTWYPITDGLGFSLVIVNENAPWDTWGDKASWRASGRINGSPGQPDPAPTVSIPVLVNEALTHTDLPELDSVELFNPDTSKAAIGGWFLTDDFYTPKKYRIPNGTTVPAGGFLVITETEFNTGPNAFRLSELGEDVYLFAADANTNLTGYYHGYRFGAAPNGVSFGRYTNSQGDVEFVLQSALTLGTNNAYPRVGPIVISEIMYHPPDTNGVDNDLDEFIELQNITATNVPLYDAGAATNTWRLRNAVDFDFPANQMLAAGTRLLVVGFDPTNAIQLARFRSNYSVPAGVPVYGPWSGKLDNSGETLELKQPDTPDVTPTNVTVPFIMIDQVAYLDTAPWPAGADGLGNSLQRVANAGFGNDPTNWFAAGVTAGRATLPDLPPTVTITFPTNNAILDASNGIPISVAANDPDGLLGLVQLLEGTNILTQWINPSLSPLTYVWSTSPAGLHQLRARAADNLGAFAESGSISFITAAAPPAVTLIAPTNGTLLSSGSTLTIIANATSGGGPAALVDFFLDGALLGSVSSPFSLSWTAGAAGTHTLSAVARDAAGQTGAPASITISVQAASMNPVLIAPGSTWKYLDNGSNQGTNWIKLGFNDATWPGGPAQLGYGDGDEATVISYGTNSSNKYITYYFRKLFVVPSLAGISNVVLSLVRDDGAIAYLNGVEVFRSNMTNGPVNYLTLAASTVTGADESAFFPTNFSPNLLTTGTNVLAVEVHQVSASSSSDVSFDAQLALQGVWLGPAFVSQPTNLSATIGSDITFSTTAAGTAPISWRWYFNNTPFGVASNMLTLTNVQPTNAGPYYVVASNLVGMATSSVASLTITVADTDGDGMPDWWELANGTDPLINDAAADPDGDGFSNLQEYLAGTNPTNALSALRFDAVQLSGPGLLLSFSAASNHDYTVQFRPLAEDGAWQKWTDIVAVPTNHMVWLTNSVGAATSRFYRLITPLHP